MILIRASTEIGLQPNFYSGQILGELLRHVKSSSWTPPVDEPLQCHPTFAAGRPFAEFYVKLNFIYGKPLTELLQQMALACSINTQQHPTIEGSPATFELLSGG